MNSNEILQATFCSLSQNHSNYFCSDYEVNSNQTIHIMSNNIISNTMIWINLMIMLWIILDWQLKQEWYIQRESLAQHSSMKGRHFWDTHHNTTAMAIWLRYNFQHLQDNMVIFSCWITNQTVMNGLAEIVALRMQCDAIKPKWNKIQGGVHELWEIQKNTFKKFLSQNFLFYHMNSLAKNDWMA